MTVERWLNPTYFLYFNNTAIGLTALLFVYMVILPILWGLIFKDPLKVTIFHKNKRTLTNLWKQCVCLLSRYLFKVMIRYFAFMDFKENQNKENTKYKLVLLEKCTLLVHFWQMFTCLYKSQTFWHRASFFRRVFYINSYQK